VPIEMTMGRYIGEVARINTEYSDTLNTRPSDRIIGLLTF